MPRWQEGSPRLELLDPRLPAGRACTRAIEDLEGSFDWDILVGDAGPNGIHGQPGRDRLFGGGGA